MVNKKLEEKGLSLKGLEGLEGLKIKDLKRLDKEFKVPNVKLVKSYGKERKL